MANPKRTFVISLAAVGIAATLMGTSISGALGPDEEMPATLAGVGGLAILLAAGYFAVVSGLATWRIARLQDASNVIARWEVSPATWAQFCDVGLAQTGVDVPRLAGLTFYPRRKDRADPVLIVCGKREVQIDGRTFSVAPGRGAGMEQAGMVRTQPPCVALVIAGWADSPRAPRIARSLLLLPIPGGAEDEANKAIRHYAAEVAGVRDLGQIARANPVAKALFWTVLGVSALAGAAGVWLEAGDYPGDLPGVLGITGILVALGTLVLGLALRRRG